MPCVMKFVNLLVASVSLGLVCLTSSCEVGKVPVAITPHVLSVSTSWQQSTPSSVLFTNNTNGFVIDEACHTQELSSVFVFIFHLYNSLSSSLGDLQVFKQGTISGAAIEESFHWMHKDIRDTILISAGLSFCTATLVGFIFWIRPASQPSSSFHTKQTGRQVQPRTVRSSSDGHAESSSEKCFEPGDWLPLVIESQTAQVSQALDIDKSNPLPTNEYSKEISATKTHDKIKQKFVQFASGRSMPPLVFSAASNEPAQCTPQQPSSIIIPGRLPQFQPSLQTNVSGGSVPLQRSHQPVRYGSSESGKPKQSSQYSQAERHVANQKEALSKPTGLVSSKQSSQDNLYGSPVFIQKPPKPIGLTFRDSIPLNALQCKGYGTLNRPQQPSLVTIESLMQSNPSLNNLTLTDQQGSWPSQFTGQKTLKYSQQNGLGGSMLIQHPPKPIGLKFRDSIPLNALQLKRYHGLLTAEC